MTIRFLCPQCGRTIRARDEAAGHSGVCTDCGAKVRVPGKAGFAPDPPETRVQRVDVSSKAMKAGFVGAFGAFFGWLAALVVLCLLIAGGVIAFMAYGQHREEKRTVGETPVGLISDPKREFVKFLPVEIEEMKKMIPGLSVSEQFKYDVRKTDSLVSPYMGTCAVDVIWHNATFIWEKDVASDLEGSLELLHAYQNGRWVFKGGNCHLPYQLGPQGTILNAFDCSFESFSELTTKSLARKRFEEDLKQKTEALKRVRQAMENEQ